MKQDYLDNLIEVGDKNHCEATMIWFHGYGANNWSFEPSMKMINLMTDGRLRILMPNAPIVDNKRSWYPLPTTMGHQYWYEIGSHICQYIYGVA